MTQEERKKEIMKPQYGCKTPPLEIIEKWISVMTEYVSISKQVDYEFSVRSRGKKNAIPKEAYDRIHAKSQELETQAVKIRTETREKYDGFWLKWAI